MSGSTTELALATAVDADDTADYLTLALANSLRTVDALFNNTTGHSHSGAHQGGPIATIPIGAIADGSITSVKIADGTITGADIADGTITRNEIAVDAITTVGWQQLGNLTTSSNAYVDVVPGTISLPVVGGFPLVIIIAAIVRNNTNPGRPAVGVEYNNITYDLARVDSTASSLFHGTASIIRLTSVAGVGQVKSRFKCFDAGGSASIDDHSWILAIEFRR